MVFCRFPDIKSNRIVEHYLFCQPVGEKATAEAIFNKINEFFEEEGLDWSKCKSVTTDGAAAMRGSQKGLIERIKRKSPECIGIHCILHREALVTKKLELNAGDASGKENELHDVLREVVYFVNTIKKSSKQTRLFSKLCEETAATSKKLLLHSEVRWLSRGKVLSRVFELREQLGAYYTERGDQKANRFRNIYWIAKLAYMASIFDRLNQVNVSLLGKGGDIFRSTSKINALKMKIQLWKNNASSGNFIDFPLLSQYLKESGWEFEDVSTINTMVTLIVGHLNLLGDKLALYFPEDNDRRLEENSWVMQPFTSEPTEDEELLELREDLNQKISFREMYYSEFWVSLFEFPEYKNLAEKAIALSGADAHDLFV
uniref:zinc finger BED domain-containing protein 5-like n=1 Tax=Styela clava TaxID=7725 RepID=UPI00193A185B|nr:zinc finger BED domain-containing protein 5-like [Styela clava]